MFKGQSTSKRSFRLSFSVKFAVDVSTKEATYKESDILKAFFPNFFPFNIIFLEIKVENLKFQSKKDVKKLKSRR